MIDIITSPRGDWVLIEKDGVAIFSGHAVSLDDLSYLLREVGQDVKRTEVTDREMEELC